MAAPVTAPTSESLIIQGLQEENKQLWKVIERQAEDYARLAQRVKALETLPRSAVSSKKKHERKMARVDEIILNHQNQFVTFADMGKLLGYPSNTRKQNMTHLHNVFKQNQDRYEVKASKLGGKMVRFTQGYLNHFLKGGE